VITAEARSRIIARMAPVGAVDTGLVLALRIAITRLGGTYSLKGDSLPGHPAIVMRRWRLAVFVKACFISGCPEHGGHKFPPFKRREECVRKVHNHQAQDQRDYLSLLNMGWRSLVVWEHDIRDDPMVAATRVMRVRHWKNGG